MGAGPKKAGAGPSKARATTGGLPKLHLVAGGDILGRPEGWARLLAVAEAGGPSLALHLRARRTPARRLYEVADRLVAVAAAHGALTLVNDRVDVAAAVGANGVHLREDSIPPEDARRLWKALREALRGAEPQPGRTSQSPGKLRPRPHPRRDGPGTGGTGLGTGGTGLVGRSIHSSAQVTEFAVGAVDYFVLGAVYETASHPGRPALGLGVVAAAAERSAVPVVAIGGITMERVASVVAAGTHGVAVVGGVWNAPDPAEAVRGYLDAFPQSSGP